MLVKDGGASIYGIVDSDFEATAIRLAAEEAAGEGNVDIQLGHFPAWSYGYVF